MAVTLSVLLDGYLKIDIRGCLRIFSILLFWLIFFQDITSNMVAALGVFSLAAQGYRLDGYLIRETSASSAIQCIQICLQEGTNCKSINFGTNSSAPKRKCQLNSEAAVNIECYLFQKLVFDNGSNYFERRVQRGKASFCMADFDHEKQDVNSSIILTAGNMSGNTSGFREQIEEWLPVKAPWHLCYRATRDGWRACTFHSRCDNKGATVTIVRVGKYIFGGYSDVSWNGSVQNRYIKSTAAFLFSLRNNDNIKPFKAPAYQDMQYAMYDSSSYGPTFGSGHDLHIADNAHSSGGSYTELDRTYKPPSGYTYSKSYTRALLAGSYYFTPSEVEVFYFG